MVLYIYKQNCLFIEIKQIYSIVTILNLDLIFFYWTFFENKKFLTELIQIAHYYKKKFYAVPIEKFKQEHQLHSIFSLY